jgi:ribonuclease BN (tRNA processing enzyme)
VEVRVLGAHQCETATTGFTSFLVDRVVAVDAGSLSSTLTLDEQLAIRTVLLTHRHWDHVKDMPGLGFTVFSKSVAGYPLVPIDVFCLQDVRETLRAQTMGEGYWLDLFQVPDPDRPVFVHRPVSPGDDFSAGPYRVTTVQANHSVPAIGFQIADSAGRTMYYTSDNGPGCGRNWVKTKPDLLLTECTYSNAQRALDAGDMFGHLCPSQIEDELRYFRELKGYLPRVVIVHVNPFYEADVRRELAGVADRLGATIELAYEGMVLRV